MMVVNNLASIFQLFMFACNAEHPAAQKNTNNRMFTILCELVTKSTRQNMLQTDPS